jgi:chromosome segregation ATPase
MNDYASRISKVEAQLESNQKEFDRLHQAIADLRQLILERSDRLQLSIDELRKDTDLKLGELRKYVDGKLAEQRKYTDSSIAELRNHVDHRIEELRKNLEQKLEAGLAEVRREAGINMRWMMGMWLTTIGMVAGLGGRIFGMY